MSLFLVGLNHKTAPLALREQLAFTDAECRAFSPQLVDGSNVSEAFVLSTCNRVEILIEGESEIAFGQVIEFLAKAKNIAAELFAENLYQFSEQEAARHLFRVASSLDSMIVGETQILGQVKQAYKIASEAGTVRRKLHKLLHHAFYAAKRVRTETRIANNAISISFAAVELARKIFGSLTDKTVLLVGAGEMAELAAKHLLEHGAKRILISNRTIENAVRLAMDFGGEVVAFEKLTENLPLADIVICSTAAPDFLITPEMTEKSQIAREYCPALFIDISVPRNIAPQVAEIENAFLYSIDDLASVITTNLEERQREAARAEAIIETEVAEFWHGLQAMSFGERLGALKNKMRETADAEFLRQRSKLGNLTPEQEAAIEKMISSIVNQIAHPILYGLRRSHEYGAAEFAETLLSLVQSPMSSTVQSPMSKAQSLSTGNESLDEKNFN